MGNVPTTPLPANTPAPQVPIAPFCDAECQKQKNIQNLKVALDQAELNQITDPEGYEQARINYYTALNGQGWLASEKERIAKDEVGPTILDYTNKYTDLVNEKNSQSAYIDVASALKSQEANDSADIKLLKKEYQEQQDKADVMNRMAQLQSPAPVSSSSFLDKYLAIILDIVIAILGLIVVVQLYVKGSSYFSNSSESLSASPV